MRPGVFLFLHLAGLGELRRAMINPEKEHPIRLDQFLKLTGLVETGGHAKALIQSGEVCVNGQVETRRRKQLGPEDVVALHGHSLRVGDFLQD